MTTTPTHLLRGFVLAAMAGSGCSDKTPTPTIEAKPAEAKPAEAKPAEAKPAEAKPAAPPAPMPTDAVAGFAGFSKDGRSFAWVVPSPSVPDLLKLSTITIGQDQPALSFVDSPEGRAKGKAALVAGGFANTKRPVPPDVTMQANLTAKPPTLSIVRGGKSVAIPIGAYPYPPTDVAELWGVSEDGATVAVHIHGKDVPGLLSKGTGGTFHFFFVGKLP